jgi:hypothetical protein
VAGLRQAAFLVAFSLPGPQPGAPSKSRAHSVRLLRTTAFTRRSYAPGVWTSGISPGLDIIRIEPGALAHETALRRSCCSQVEMIACSPRSGGNRKPAPQTPPDHVRMPGSVISLMALMASVTMRRRPVSFLAVGHPLQVVP